MIYIKILTLRYLHDILTLHLLPPKDMFPLICQAPLPAAFSPPLPHKVLHPWPCPGIHNMGPVLGGAQGQLLEPLHQQHTGVADLTTPSLFHMEAAAEERLVLLAGSEPGAAGLGLADAAAVQGPVH